MKPSRIWAVSCVLVVLAAACGDDSADVPAAGGTVGSFADTLTGTSWVAQQLTDDTGGRVVLAGSEPTIEFSDDGHAVTGSTGCNTYSGDVMISEGTISVERVSATERACSPPQVMEQESVFLTVLTSANTLAVVGGVLELSGAGGSVLFVEAQPVVDAALAGIEWLLNSLIDGDTAISVVAATAPSLTVDIGEGSVRGTTGCNTFNGEVTIRDSEFEVTGLTWTEIGCASEIMRQEAFIFEVLQNATRHVIEGDGLTILGTDGQSLQYRTG